MSNTIFTALLDARKAVGGKFKILQDAQGDSLSYDDIITRSFILGRYIAKHSKAQERIGIMLPNVNATAITFLGMQAFGRVPTMLNFSAGLMNLKSACKTAEIKTIYTSKKFIEKAELQEEEQGLISAGVNLVYLEDLRSQIGLLDKLRGVLNSTKPPKGLLNKIKADDTAVILFTSGSEGSPKGVALSHDNLLSNCDQLCEAVEFTKDDRMLNALPMFHCFGLTVGTILPLLKNMFVLLHPSPLHFQTIPELIRKDKTSIFFATDTFLNGYARYAKDDDFKSLRLVFAGAEKLKKQTRLLYQERFGVEISEGYGVTETSPVLNVNTPEHKKVGTVGRLLPQVQYRLEPVDGIQDGGRLWVKGPNIMQGYMRESNPGVIEPLKDGWHDTGDIVNFDEQGFMSIKGRAKRFAKVGGESVSLTAIENYLMSLWPEQRHATISISDAKRGEKIILITDYANANREDMVNYVREHGISELSIPREIIVVGEVPILSTGKIDYVSLNQKYNI